MRFYLRHSSLYPILLPFAGPLLLLAVTSLSSLPSRLTPVRVRCPSTVRASGPPAIDRIYPRCDVSHHFLRDMLLFVCSHAPLTNRALEHAQARYLSEVSGMLFRREGCPSFFTRRYNGELLHRAYLLSYEVKNDGLVKREVRGFYGVISVACGLAPR